MNETKFNKIYEMISKKSQTENYNNLENATLSKLERQKVIDSFEYWQSKVPDIKIKSSERSFENRTYGVYIIKRNNVYFTSMIAIKEATSGRYIIDNISAHENKSLIKVKDVYNKISDVITSNNEKEILNYIESEVKNNNKQ